jgi:hypothetical protein
MSGPPRAQQCVDTRRFTDVYRNMMIHAHESCQWIAVVTDYKTSERGKLLQYRQAVRNFPTGNSVTHFELHLHKIPQKTANATVRYYKNYSLL